MTKYLASFNTARARADLDDPAMAEFFAAVDAMNALAERMPGFVWRNKDEGNFSQGLAADPRILSTLSVWQDHHALSRYVFQTVHRQFYARRHEWFEAFDGPYLVFWHVKPGNEPTMAEGFSRLADLRLNGQSKRAFDWDYMAQ